MSGGGAGLGTLLVQPQPRGVQPGNGQHGQACCQDGGTHLLMYSPVRMIPHVWHLKQLTCHCFSRARRDWPCLISSLQPAQSGGTKAGRGVWDHRSSLAGGSAARQEHPHLLAHAEAPLAPRGKPCRRGPPFLGDAAVINTLLLRPLQEKPLGDHFFMGNHFFMGICHLCLFLAKEPGGKPPAGAGTSEAPLAPRHPSQAPAAAQRRVSLLGWRI